MTMIILPHSHFDAAHLAQVKAEMGRLGSPTIRVIDGGDHYIAIEGSHRLRAAAESETAVAVQIIDEAGEIDLDTLDIDDNGWFGGERVVPAADFVAWFTKSPFPMDAATVDVEIA